MSKLDEIEAELVKCRADRMRFTGPMLVEDMAAACRYVRAAEAALAYCEGVLGDTPEHRLLSAARRALGIES